MTIGEWIAARATGAPTELVEQASIALGAAAHADVAEAPERCVDAAARLVSTLLAENRTGRDAALALLAADALATWAFEAAAGEPARLPARAAAAMHRLATG